MALTLNCIAHKTAATLRVSLKYLKPNSNGRNTISKVCYRYEIHKVAASIALTYGGEITKIVFNNKTIV